MKTKIIILFSFLLYWGCNKDSVNETLINGNRITAAHNLSAVESLAATNYNDLQLVSVKNDNLEYDGYADKWSFRYTSGGIAVDYYFHTTSKEVKFDSTSTLQIDGSSFINHQWFDSNEALQIAEENGGKDFRDKNQNYKIEASLGEPLVPNSSTYWYVTYRSKLDYTENLILVIDAKTGELK